MYQFIVRHLPIRHHRFKERCNFKNCACEQVICWNVVCQRNWLPFLKWVLNFKYLFIKFFIINWFESSGQLTLCSNWSHSYRWSHSLSSLISPDNWKLKSSVIWYSTIIIRANAKSIGDTGTTTGRTGAVTGTSIWPANVWRRRN